MTASCYGLRSQVVVAEILDDLVSPSVNIGPVAVIAEMPSKDPEDGAARPKPDRTGEVAVAVRNPAIWLGALRILRSHRFIGSEKAPLWSPSELTLNSDTARSRRDTGLGSMKLTSGCSHLPLWIALPMIRVEYGEMSAISTVEPQPAGPRR